MKTGRHLLIIDCHVHCGVQNEELPYEKIKLLLDEAGISAACMFPPVEDIYDRWDPRFRDTPEWQSCRRRANRYLLDLSRDCAVFPYFFVWNDFARDELTADHKGIKWHRHFDEPAYEYDSPLCEGFLRKVYEMNIPVVLEETYDNTLSFITRVDGRIPVIIPHLGILNGGYNALKSAGVWKCDNIYADTALASPGEILDYISSNGEQRLLFGSDFPFGMPAAERNKILGLNLAEEQLQAIFSRNIQKLLSL